MSNNKANCYGSPHTKVNSLNRILEHLDFFVQVETNSSSDCDTEWKVVILDHKDDVVSKTHWEDDLSTAIAEAVKRLGVIV